MNERFKFRLLLAVAIVWLPSAALAKANVTVAIMAEKEVIVSENGKEVTRIVAAKDILPGEVVTYTLNFANSGDEAAKGVEISNRIPAETSYLFGSATEGSGDLTFSIDNGKTFNKPALLNYESPLPNGTREKRVALPEQYTHIRWIIPNLPAKGQGSVSFKAKVK
jgi:uncharacterized repeat protein (TIGR01451 family)